MEEIWKDVLGYEGIYQVSNIGRVKSLKLDKEKILKGCLDTKGYLRVRFYNNNKGETLKIHRLVAVAFLGFSNLQVNHKNGNKTDNRIENLEFVSVRENNTHHQLKNINKTSKFIGVSFDKKLNKWKSQIQINKKGKLLGRFKNESDAHKAYLKALEENNLVNKYATSNVNS